MKTYLKIKIKSLAAEAAIIKHEERRWKAAPRQRGESPHPLFWGLRDHRLRVVRTESRAALLAYGFLRGRPLMMIEKPKEHNQPNWSRIENLAKKYSQNFDAEKFKAWKEGC